jgi:hypothetical protein
MWRFGIEQGIAIQSAQKRRHGREAKRANRGANSPHSNPVRSIGSSRENYRDIRPVRCQGAE